MYTIYGRGRGPKFHFLPGIPPAKRPRNSHTCQDGGGEVGGEIASLGGAPRLFKGTKLISLAENSFKIENLDSFRIPR